MVEEQSIELFVTEAESLVLETLAQAEAPHSQRAQALLAVDAGSTIEQAAAVANLKVTQVRFWIGRFRNGRLTVFPESVIKEIESALKGAAKNESLAKTKKKKKEKKGKKTKEIKQKKKGAKKSGKKKK